jgi:hypothetical protein
METRNTGASQNVYTPERAGALPTLAHVRQHFDTAAIADVAAAITQEIRRTAQETIRPGMHIAITAGSRGIAHIPNILAAVAQEVHRLGGSPFIVAAMGSHGGATSAGQRAVLQGYGITEERIGCPIVCDMDTVCLGHTDAGVAVHCNRSACKADGIILVNRVKPHTILTGDLGSGLIKMASIGLGNALGANTIHALGIEQHVLPAARMVLAHAPVKLGLAIVENSYDQTWKIEGVPVADIEAADRRLLTEARALLPIIPFDPIDVLIIDMIGKNFAGTGMDPNVIGMHRRIGGPAQRQIGRIVALDLSAESHGNAHGVGMADIITQTLRDKIDWHTTYTNGITSGFLGGGKLPLTCATRQDAVMLALKPFAMQQARVVHICNTAHLEDMWVSAALLDKLSNFPHIEQVGGLEVATFEE